MNRKIQVHCKGYNWEWVTIREFVIDAIVLKKYVTGPRKTII